MDTNIDIKEEHFYAMTGTKFRHTNRVVFGDIKIYIFNEFLSYKQVYITGGTKRSL